MRVFRRCSVCRARFITVEDIPPPGDAFLPQPGCKKAAVRSVVDRNALVAQWLDLVPWALYQLPPRIAGLGQALGHADAKEIGRLGLLRAAELWDTGRGTFSTYAVHWIRGTVRKAVAAWRVQQRRLPPAADPLPDVVQPERDQEWPAARIDLALEIDDVLRS